MMPCPYNWATGNGQTGYSLAKFPQSLSDLPERTLVVDEVLIEEGDQPGGLYFLKRGALIITKADVEIARIAEPGAVFGEMSYLLQKPATAQVTALQETVVHVAENPGMFLLDNPDVLIYVAGTMAKRLESVNRYLVDLKNQFALHREQPGGVDEVVANLMARYPKHERRRVPGDEAS